MVSAIVLAAGSSQRMGPINKLLLNYKSNILVAHVVENILKAGIQDVVVVGGFEAEKIKDFLKDMPVQFVINDDHRNGLTTSIQTGVHLAKGDGYMICLADMVLIEPGEYFLMLSAFEKQKQVDSECICLPVYQNQKGNPVIFSSFYKQAILSHEEAEGCKEIVQLNRKHVFMITMNTNHILQDIDYPEDMAILKE